MRQSVYLVVCVWFEMCVCVSLRACFVFDKNAGTRVSGFTRFSHAVRLLASVTVVLQNIQSLEVRFF